MTQGTSGLDDVPTLAEAQHWLDRLRLGTLTFNERDRENIRMWLEGIIASSTEA